jgi:hypothetical protein
MTGRFAQKLMCYEPLARCPVKRINPFRLSFVEPGLQEGAKEMMIAIRIPLVVKRDDK